MNNILLSICIPTYNRADFVYECVSDLLKESSECGYVDIVVIDNCSTDDTREKLHSIQDKRLHYYCNPRNIGFANLGYCLTKGNGKYCMLFGDKDSIESVDWELLKKELEDSDDVAAFICRYNDGKGNALVIPPDKIYIEKQVDTYLYARNACRYSAALIVNREIATRSWSQIDTDSYLCSVYSQTLVAAYGAQFGKLAPIHGIIVKQDARRTANRPLHEGTWNGTSDEPYWTINARLWQDLDYVDVYENVALDPGENRERLLRVLVYWNLGELANYCEMIYFSLEASKNYLYVMGKEFIMCDRAKTSAEWSQIFWDHYMLLNKKIEIDIKYDATIMYRKYRRLMRFVAFSKLGFLGGILLHFPTYAKKMIKTVLAKD